MDAAAPLTLAPPTRPRWRHAPLVAWLAFAPVAVWLGLLVVLPTGLLVAVSFCQTDPDLATPVWAFTWEHYATVFEPAVRPLLWHAGAFGGVVAVIAGLAVRRTWAVRWGLLLGFAAWMHVGVAGLADGAGAYVRIFWRSVEWAGLATGLCLAIGYPVAFAVGRARPPWRGRLLLAVLIPFWTSFLIRTYAWVTILNQHGLLNATLRAVRLGGLVPASGSYLYTPGAVVLGLVYAYLPFMILPIYAAVDRLDPALIEASLDLGAGPVRTVARIIVPLTAPGVAGGVLLVFVPAIGMYAVNGLLGGNASPMIGDYINDQYGAAADQPLGATLGVVVIAAFALALLATGTGRRRAR